MDPATIARLNAINRAFYQTTALEFDSTRGRAWPGWTRLLPHLKPPLSVLDVGCGNGRLGVFLAENIGTTDAPLHYVGMDNNRALLDAAQTALNDLPNVQATFIEHDIMSDPPDSGQYDLVALFGVMHHIPGYDQRQALIRTLAERVAPGGMLAFACWRFYEYDRFRERIVPWPEDISVEANDYLLDWRRGERAIRYCHYVDDAEHAALVKASGLRDVETYRADGFSGAVNRYSLLMRD